jgi:hypothetical protein
MRAARVAVRGARPGHARLDAHDLELLVHVDGGPRPIRLHDVGFVRRVAVGVRLHADDRGTGDLGERGLPHLGRGVAGQQRLVAALATPRVLGVRGARGRVDYRRGRGLARGRAVGRAGDAVGAGREPYCNRPEDD